MKIKLNRQELLEKMILSTRFTSTKISSLAVLQGIYIKIDKTKLHLHSSDINSFFHTNVPVESDKDGEFIIEPLEPGYGHTLGNALRRILLSSIPDKPNPEIFARQIEGLSKSQDMLMAGQFVNGFRVAPSRLVHQVVSPFGLFGALAIVDGDVDAQALVQGAVDRTHAAASEFLKDAVPIVEERAGFKGHDGLRYRSNGVPLAYAPRRRRLDLAPGCSAKFRTLGLKPGMPWLRVE